MTERLPVACAVALAAPLLAATVLVLSIAAGERLGATPFAGLVARNSAEAAGLARAGEMLRFLRAGESPHAVHPLRPEAISSSVLRATTLEAAIWSRQVELLDLLARVGALDNPGDRRQLACLAQDLGADDLVEYLAPDGTSHCEPGAALERVQARSRS